MKIINCSLYYDSFSKIGLRKMQYIALLTVLFCNPCILIRMVAPFSCQYAALV